MRANEASEFLVPQYACLYKKGYIQTTLANSTGFSNYENRDLRNDALKFNYDSYESDFNMKSEISYQVNSSNNFIFGGTGRIIKFKNIKKFAEPVNSFSIVHFLVFSSLPLMQSPAN